MTAEQMAKLLGIDAAELPNLTTLSAWGNPKITDAGLAHVPNLTTLDAGGNSGITDAGRRLVAERARKEDIKP